MAMGEKGRVGVPHENEGLAIGLVRRTSFGRKRILLSDIMDFDSTVLTPAKKHCSEDSFLNSEKSPLETLPKDILIRILCGVEHDDLKRLFLVSRSIREATLIAKLWHFEYRTPTKTSSVQDCVQLKDLNEVEAPNAPRQLRIPRSRLSRRRLAGISVALFASPDEDGWPKKDLDMKTEAELRDQAKEGFV